MPIVEHPTVEHKVRAPWGYEKCQVVECDFCHRHAHKVGNDAGEAADVARREGFQTVKGAQLGDPRKWWCGKCSTG
jgi:hypothetical protein